MKPRLLILVVLSICLSAAFWWGYLRPVALWSSPHVSWRAGAPDRAIVVRVTRQHAPVSGYAVESESHSGTEGERRTDSSGVALLQQGEPEIIALHLDHQRVPLRPLPGGDFFAPSCTTGITFDVSL